MRTLVLLLALFIGGGALLAVEAPPVHTASGERSGTFVAGGTGGDVAGDLMAPNPVAEDASALVGDGESGGDSFGLTVDVGEGREGTSTVIKIMLLITVLAVAPGFMVMMTSFTRIVIVLGFVRRALGTQTLPPNQVVLGLSLFLTLFTMAPTIESINDRAVQPYLAEEITEDQAVDAATDAIRDFMGQHTRKQDLALFITIAGEERPDTIEDVSFLTLVPAFATSELKTAFQMGFVLFLPFIIIDLVIAAVLMSLGMMMLPPIIVSLPFKILLFVLVDGWALLVQSLAASYVGGG